MTQSLDWATEPPHARMLYVFLAVVCLITIVRIVRLAWALFAAPWRERISIEHAITRRVAPDHLAKAALARAISHKGPSSVSNVTARRETRRALRMANARFNYRWRALHARVAATNGLFRIALLGSLALLCAGVFPAFTLAYNDTNRTGYDAWMFVGSGMLARLVIALSVCIAIAGVHAFFEGRLIRRKASWRLFYATARDALTVPPSVSPGPDAMSGPGQ